MTFRNPLARLLLTGVAALTLSTVAAAPAMAKDGDVKARGNCSARTDWKLKAGPRDGGIETEFEVDSNVNGQAWSVRITDDGVAVFTGSRTTHAPSGSFSVERHIPNRAGTDSIVARATNARTGERCVATVKV